MKFTIKRTDLVAALAKVVPVAGRKANSLPILGNILLILKNDNLSIQATDLEVSVKADTAATVVKAGEITVPAKKFNEIIKELQGEEVSFTLKESDKVEIVCGKAKFSIGGIEASQFPAQAASPAELMKIAASTLLEMIQQVRSSICQDETKYNLCGIYMHVEKGANGELGKLKMVTTDGHRCSASKTDFESSSEVMEKGIILPKDGISELLRLAAEPGDDPVSFGITEKNAYFQKGDMELSMRLIDGNFPDYKRVIPQANDKNVFVEKSKFVAALKRISLLCVKATGFRVEMTPGNMLLTATNPSIGDCREEVEVEYEGAAITLCLNPLFLLDMVKEIKGDVEISLKSATEPLIVKPKGGRSFLSVLMPMRLPTTTQS